VVFETFSGVVRETTRGVCDAVAVAVVGRRRGGERRAGGVRRRRKRGTGERVRGIFRAREEKSEERVQTRRFGEEVPGFGGVRVRVGV